MAAPKPVLKDKILTITKDRTIHIDSKEWQDFIKTSQSIKYVPRNRSMNCRYEFTCRCNFIRNGYYWYAYRKVNGRLRQEYIGKDENMNYLRLEEVADYISLNDYEYWSLKNKKKRERKLVSVKVVNSLNEKLARLILKIKANATGYSSNDATALIKDIFSLSNDINIK